MSSSTTRDKGKAPERAQAGPSSPSNPQANASAESDAIDDEAAPSSSSNPRANASAGSDAIDDESTSQPPAKEEALNVLLYEGQNPSIQFVKRGYKLAGNLTHNGHLPHIKLALNDGIRRNFPTGKKVPAVLNVAKKEEKKKAGQEGVLDWDKIHRGEVEAGTAITVEFYRDPFAPGVKWKRRWYITERGAAGTPQGEAPEDVGV